MIHFNMWYRRLGLIRPGQLLNPRVIESATLTYPRNSEVYYFKVSDAYEYITRDIEIFKKPVSIFVKTILEYGEDRVGSFRSIPYNFPRTIKEIGSKEKTMRFLRPAEERIMIKPKTLVIKNYGSINRQYRYIRNAFAYRDKYLNTINTVIRDINKDKSTSPELIKPKFLVIELPMLLPRREKLELFMRTMNIQRLKSITDFRYFTFIELWKFLTPEFKEQSVFNKITEEVRPFVNLLFSFNGKCFVLNMQIMLDYIKEYVEGDKGTESLELEDNLEVFLSSFETISTGLESTEVDYKTLKNTAVALSRASYPARQFKKIILLLCNKLISSTLAEIAPDSENDKEFTQEAIAKELLTSEKGVNETVTEIKAAGKSNPIDLENGKIVEAALDRVIEENLNIYSVKDVNKDSILGEEFIKQVDEEGEESTTTLEEIENANNAKYVREKSSLVKYNSIEEIYSLPAKDATSILKRDLDNLREEGLVSKKRYERCLYLMSELESIDNLPGSLKGRKIKEILDVTNDRALDAMKEYTLTPNPSVIDTSYNKGTIEGFDKQYLSEQIDKDRVRVMTAFRNSGLIVSHYEVEETNDILNENERHTIYITPLNTTSNKSTKLSVIVPKVKEDGTFKLSGNTYRLRKQRVEKTISKISPTEVVLTSYYGKRFIEKAIDHYRDLGMQLARIIIKHPDTTNVITGSTKFINTNLPNLYFKLARGIKSFVMEDKVFFFENRSGFVDVSSFPTYEESGLVACGYFTDEDSNKNGTKVIFMDKDGMLYTYQNDPNTVTKKIGLKNPSMTPYIHFLELIDPSGEKLAKRTVEYAVIKVKSVKVPIFFLLCYYLGIDTLFKVLKTEHYIFTKDDKSWREANNREKLKDFYRVEFKDVNLFIKKDYGVNDIVFGCMTDVSKYEEVFKDTPFDCYQKKELFNIVFNYLNLSPSVTIEIDMLEKLFIDPMTLSLLIQNGEPQTFPGLLLKASELLSTDFCPKPTHIESQYIKGYERINGMLYASVVDTISRFERDMIRSKATLTLEPFCLINKLKEDSTQVLVDDLNPISYIKQREDVSYLGEGGQSGSRSINKSRRAVDESEIGIVSEAHKDNGDVGVTAYLCPDFNIKNSRGKLESIDVSNEGWGKVLSTPGLLAPFATRDDSKRFNFVSIMSSHVVPIQEMKAPIIRTGYESVLPIRVGERYCITAKKNGAVVTVTDTSVVVKYDGDQSDTTYKLRKWSTKEEAGSCYSYHSVPNVLPKQTFKKDDTLVYNPYYFEPDIFNPARVIYKQGTYVNVAITEDKETYEDSGGISKKMTKVMSSKLTKVRSIIINNQQEIFEPLQIGQTVKPTDILFSFMDIEAASIDSDDPEIARIVKDVNTSSPLAKVQGVIKDIKIFYRSNLEDVKSKTLKKFIKDSDVRLRSNLPGETDYTGQVDNTYSVEGKPLADGEIQIKYYIEVEEDMSIGDKAILGNQLKFTVGDIYNNKVTTVDSGHEIDVFFSYISIKNRIVVSPDLIGTTAMLLEVLQDKIVDMYFKP